jgi:hypothetical protein
MIFLSSLSKRHTLLQELFKIYNSFDKMALVIFSATF